MKKRYSVMKNSIAILSLIFRTQGSFYSSDLKRSWPWLKLGTDCGTTAEQNTSEQGGKPRTANSQVIEMTKTGYYSHNPKVGGSNPPPATKDSIENKAFTAGSMHIAPVSFSQCPSSVRDLIGYLSFGLQLWCASLKRFPDTPGCGALHPAYLAHSLL
jgi:hypothetical protein